MCRQCLFSASCCIRASWTLNHDNKRYLIFMTLASYSNTPVANDCEKTHCHSPTGCCVDVPLTNVALKGAQNNTTETKWNCRIPSKTRVPLYPITWDTPHASKGENSDNPFVPPPREDKKGGKGGRQVMCVRDWFCNRLWHQRISNNIPVTSYSAQHHHRDAEKTEHIYLQVFFFTCS